VNNNSNISQDFVPQVIKLCEYEFFITNMKEAAESRKNRELAIEKSHDKNISKTNMSGYFRKILVTAIHNLADVVIHHTDGEELIFKYSLPFFGRTSKNYLLDGEIREKENMWGKLVKTNCFEADGKVNIVLHGPSYSLKGINTSTFTIESADGEEGEFMVWRRVVTDENDNIFANLALYFKRETDEDAIESAEGQGNGGSRK